MEVGCFLARLSKLKKKPQNLPDLYIGQCVQKLSGKIESIPEASIQVLNEIYIFDNRFIQWNFLSRVISQENKFVYFSWIRKSLPAKNFIASIKVIQGCWLGACSAYQVYF